MAKTRTIIIYVIMYICIIKMLLIKNMVEKKLFAKTLPVLLGFFVMGFCDIVGISSDYAASAFGWSATMAGLIPSVVFLWFFLLGVPFGLMMNRIGRKNTVLTSMAVTVVGMAIPLLHYDSVTTLAGGVSKFTPSFKISQSPNFHKLGLCYSIIFLYLYGKKFLICQRYNLFPI